MAALAFPSSSSSSVLDRVRKFLPLIEQANIDLEAKIRAEGVAGVQIDASIGESVAAAATEAGGGGGGVKQMVVVDDEEEDEEEEDNDDEDDEDEDEANEKAHSSSSSGGGGGGSAGGGILGANEQRLVQLEFALGDFEGTALALAEEAMKIKSNFDEEKEEG